MEHISIEVSALDIDLFNTQVTFSSLDSDYFDVGTSVTTSDNGRRFYATLTTKNQILEINNEIRFTITATDSGTPPKTSNTIVVMSGDPAVVFLESPEFVKNIYTGRLLNTNVLEFTEILSITTTTVTDDISITIIGEDQQFFEYTNVAVNQYSIQLSSDFTSAAKDNKAFFQIEMVATSSTGQFGHTVIIIDIEPDVEITLEFEQVLYTGDFKLPNDLNIGTIKLTDDSYSDGVVFTLEGGKFSKISDYKQMFYSLLSLFLPFWKGESLQLQIKLRMSVKNKMIGPAPDQT